MNEQATGPAASSDDRATTKKDATPKPTIRFLYGLNDSLTPAKGVLYGAQHMLLMLPSTVLAPALLAAGLHLSTSLAIALTSATLLAAGIATVLQWRSVYLN